MKYILLLFFVFFLFGCGEKELMEALEANDLVTAEKLLENGADPNYAKVGSSGSVLRRSRSCANPLRRAFVGNKNVLAKVKLLVKYGAKINYDACGDGYPVLHYTARYYDFETMKFLLDQGAKIDVRDRSSGNTMLHLVAAKGKFEMMKELVERGASLEAKNRMGKTSIFRCFLSYKMVSYLIEKGAKYDVDDDGYHLFFQLASSNQVKQMKLMIDLGIDISFVQDGVHAIHYAASSGSIDVVRFLVENGVPFDLKSEKGMTPLEKAIKHNTKRIRDSFGKEIVDPLGRDRQKVVDYLESLTDQ